MISRRAKVFVCILLLVFTVVVVIRAVNGPKTDIKTPIKTTYIGREITGSVSDPITLELDLKYTMKSYAPGDDEFTGSITLYPYKDEADRRMVFSVEPHGGAYIDVNRIYPNGRWEEGSVAYTRLNRYSERHMRLVSADLWFNQGFSFVLIDDYGSGTTGNVYLFYSEELGEEKAAELLEYVLSIGRTHRPERIIDPFN